MLILSVATISPLLDSASSLAADVVAEADEAACGLSAVDVDVAAADWLSAEAEAAVAVCALAAAELVEEVL